MHIWSVLSHSRVTSVDSTAIAGNDYLAINNQIVSFSPGNTKQTLDISISDDQFVENTESLLLYLSTGGSSKVILGTPNATVVLIQDNDGRCWFVQTKFVKGGRERKINKYKQCKVKRYKIKVGKRIK